MAISDSFNNTRFFIEVFTINQKFAFDQMLTAGKTVKNHLYKGTESEKYAKRILYQFLDLGSSIDTLGEIPIYFSIDKVPRFYLRNGVLEIQYYKYHIENHYIKISSIGGYQLRIQGTFF